MEMSPRISDAIRKNFFPPEMDRFERSNTDQFFAIG